jgi:hypothetical protein
MLRALRKLVMIATPAAMLALPTPPVQAEQSGQPEAKNVQLVRDGWRYRGRGYGRGYRWSGNRYYYQPYRSYYPGYRYYSYPQYRYYSPRYYAPYGGSYYNNYAPYGQFGFSSPWGSVYYY